MKLLNLDNSVLMDVSTLKRDGDDLVIKGQILGSMPITAKLTPEQARAALKMLDLKTMLFLASMLFRGTKKNEKKG